MIISNLTGGLGNQMFQYAFGRYLAIKNNTDLKLHFTNALFNTQYSYGLGVFNIKAEITNSEDLKKLNIVENRQLNRILYLLDERFGIQLNPHTITQKIPYRFDSKYMNIGNNSYVQGFWNDERYFADVKDIIQREFTLKDELDVENQKILNLIKNTNSVSIHVRRGDLITNKMNEKFIGTEYYINAIRKIEINVKNPKYFVFSDDIQWCKENLSNQIKNAYYVDNNSGRYAYKDLLLMSSCKNNIIANSTFSWWASYLNTNNKKYVIFN